MAAEIDVPVTLDLEHRLTIAVRRRCECARYLVSRRDVLLPEVVKQAQHDGVDPVDTFARFARGVHKRHLSGRSLAVTS